MTATVTPEPTARLATAWTIDPAHSSAEFAVRHLMVSTVKGRLNVRSGRILAHGEDPEQASVEAEIDVASVDTGMAARDAHLRSADFFDAENHPVMRFRSTRVERTGEDEGLVYGELTIRGVTRPLVLRATLDGLGADPSGSRRVGITAEATIDRKDFGLNWNQALETGGVLVGDKVRISLSVAATEGSA